MNERLNELRLDTGIAQLRDDPRLVVIDREGNVIDPLIGLEKFAELIVRECMYVGRLSQINNGLVDSDIKEHFGVNDESKLR